MNFMKMMGALNNLPKLKAEAEAAAAELKTHEHSGAAGGGLVSVRINGAGQMLACSIDEQLVADGDREMIEELVVAAVNQAADTAKKSSMEFMQQRLAGSLNMPEIGSMLGNFMGK